MRAITPLEPANRGPLAPSPGANTRPQVAAHVGPPPQVPWSPLPRPHSCWAPLGLLCVSGPWKSGWRVAGAREVMVRLGGGGGREAQDRASRACLFVCVARSRGGRGQRHGCFLAPVKDRCGAAPTPEYCGQYQSVLANLLQPRCGGNGGLCPCPRRS